jgi:hypothetical protein
MQGESPALTEFCRATFDGVPADFRAQGGAAFPLPRLHSRIHFYPFQQSPSLPAVYDGHKL